MIETIIINIILILGAVFLLVKSADLITETCVRIAKRLGIGEFLIGFFVMGLLTSLPEFSVAINSISNGIPDLTIGNLLGASLVLVTLVVGLNAVIRREIPFHGKFNSRELMHTLVVILLPVVTLVDQDLTFGEGLVLIGAYLTLIVHLRRIFSHKKYSTFDKLKSVKIDFKTTLTIFIKLVIGVVGLVVMSSVVIDNAISVAEAFNVNIALVGIFLLAIGTNLPELVILLRADNQREERFAVGNFLGSASVNTLTVGLIGIIRPHQLSGFVELVPVMILLTFAVLLFLLLERTRSALNRNHGLILIAVYVAMILGEIVAKLINK
jgi:cation:H+ antiporter